MTLATYYCLKIFILIHSIPVQSHVDIRTHIHIYLWHIAMRIQQVFEVHDMYFSNILTIVHSFVAWLGTVHYSGGYKVKQHLRVCVFVYG